MKIDRFPPGVTNHLKWYVYRLVDPRNHKTFYVGKGRGNRIFHHVKCTLKVTKRDTAVDLKFSLIREIKKTGQEVDYVIHRHNIEKQDVAFLIEASLIDVYQNLANKVRGHGTDKYGCRKIEKIITQYAAKPFKAKEPLILISIARSSEEGKKGIYKAVRGVWRVNVSKAEKFKLVLAHRHGIVEGAFRPKKWLPAKKDNFPWIQKNMPKRFGFVGVPAEQAVEKLYIDKKVPDMFRPKGAANPVRFISEV